VLVQQVVDTVVALLAAPPAAPSASPAATTGRLEPFLPLPLPGLGVRLP